MEASLESAVTSPDLPEATGDSAPGYDSPNAAPDATPGPGDAQIPVPCDKDINVHTSDEGAPLSPEEELLRYLLSIC